MTVTNQNLIQEEIKRRPNSGNACYHSVQTLLSSRLLSKNLKVRIHKTIILPVVLCGCETWSLIVREEHKVRVFENRVLRRIFGPKRDGVTGGWRKLHNAELHDLYNSPSIIRIIKPKSLRWVGHVARMGEKRNAHRWVNNIKLDLVEMRWCVVDWLGLVQDRYRWRAFVNMEMNLRVPKMLGNYRGAAHLVASREVLSSTELVI
jgi:hypothetical protein